MFLFRKSNSTHQILQESIGDENKEKILRHGHIYEGNDCPTNTADKIEDFKRDKKYLQDQQSNQSSNDPVQSYWKRTVSFFFPPLLSQFGNYSRNTQGDHKKIQEKINFHASLHKKVNKHNTIYDESDNIFKQHYDFNEYKSFNHGPENRKEQAFSDYLISRKLIDSHLQRYTLFMQHTKQALNTYHEGLKTEKETWANSNLEDINLNDCSIPKNNIAAAYLDVNHEKHEAARDLLYALEAKQRRAKDKQHVKAIEDIQDKLFTEGCVLSHT